MRVAGAERLHKSQMHPTPRKAPPLLVWALPTPGHDRNVRPTDRERAAFPRLTCVTIRHLALLLLLQVRRRPILVALHLLLGGGLPRDVREPPGILPLGKDGLTLLSLERRFRQTSL